MTSRLTEDAIEQFAIEQLKAYGYAYLHGATIAPDSATAERGSYEDVLLLGRVKAAISRLNPAIPAGTTCISQSLLCPVSRPFSPGLSIATRLERDSFLPDYRGCGR